MRRAPLLPGVLLLALLLVPNADAMGIREYRRQAQAEQEQTDEEELPEEEQAEAAPPTEAAPPAAGAAAGAAAEDARAPDAVPEASEARLVSLAGGEPPADGGPDGADLAADEVLDVIVVDDMVFDIHRAPIAFDHPSDALVLSVRLEADRRLLSELRKQIPTDRAEAELYLRRIRELAAISDPVTLVPLANNVIRQAPLLFVWLETEYDDPDERERDYYIGGPWAFHRRFETFRNAVLLTIIRRLDAVADRLEGVQ